MNQFRLWLLLSLAFMAASSYASTVIPVDTQLRGQAFGTSMRVLLDENNEFSIQDILEERQKQNFTAVELNAPRFGFTQATIWLEMNLENTKATSVPVYIESRYTLLDYLHLYAIEGGEVVQVQRLGDRNPYHNRLVKDRHSVFALEVPPGISRYYIEVYSEGSINIPLHFWSPDNFYRNSKQEYLIAGLVLGFLIVMLFYNLFLAISFRSKTYAVYVCYIVSFVIYQLGILGIGKELLADYSWQDFVQNTGLLLSIQGANLFACLFAMFFLDLKARMPKLRRFFIYLNAMNILIIFAVLLASYNLSAKVVNLISLITALVLIGSGVYNIFRGYRPAIYFTLAWIGILVGNVGLALSVAGVIPVSFFTTWGQSFGGALEVVLLSLALGDRVNYIRSMHENKIKSLNKELQHHIEDIEEIVFEKTRDIKSIMAHINQGIFTIHDSDQHEDGLEVGDDYSHHLVELLGEESISKRSAMELIFDRSDLTTDAKSRIVETLRASLNEDPLNFFANRENLAHEFRFLDKQGEEKIIELDWSPVIDEKEQMVDKILVTLRDVTKLRELQVEARLQQEELEYIAEILNVEAQKFNKLLDIAYQYLEENRRLIDRSVERNNEILKILFINMHTLKGMARSYNLLKMTDAIHNVEKYYAILQKDPEHSWEKGKLQSDLESVVELFDRYNSININKLNRGSEKNRISLEKSFIRQKISMLAKLDTSKMSKADQEIIADTRKSFSSIFFQNSEKVFQEIFSNIDTLSRDLGKDKPIIRVQNSGFNISEDGTDILQKVFTHIIRNSIDHGIETGTERIKKGKLPEGEIQIEMLRDEKGYLVIRYSDDGVGLNIKKLKSIAEKRSILTKDELEDPIAVAYTIFADGLSTAPSVTEISGRGVGMGAIKQFIELAGGNFQLFFKEEPRLDTDGLPFGIMISLPDRYYIYNEEKLSA